MAIENQITPKVAKTLKCAYGCDMPTCYFRKIGDGKFDVLDASDNARPVLGVILEVDDIETGRGRGYVIYNAVTEHFFETKENAGDFLLGLSDARA